MELRDILCRLEAVPGVIGVEIKGSYASGDNDEFSDCDLDVTCSPGMKRDLWSRRREVFRSLGPLKCTADVNDMVPYSSIAFFQGGRVHIDLVCPQDCTCEAHEEPELPDVLGAGRFIFWLNRVVVSLGRSDSLSLIEAQLRCAEFLIWAHARREGRRFRGLKGVGLADRKSAIAFLAGDGGLGDISAFATQMLRVVETLGSDPSLAWASDTEVALMHDLLLCLENRPSWL